MAKKTQQRAAGSYGARYGRTIRKLVQDIHNKAHDTYECPNCSKKAVKRTSTSIWECTKCNSKFAGAAYQFSTDADKMIKRALEKPSQQ